MMKLKHFYFNPFREHCGLISDNAGNAAIVDPGAMTADELDSLESYIAAEGLKPAAILLTHAHFDHIYAVRHLQDKFNIPVYMHPDEKEVMKISAKDAARYNLPVPDTGFITTDVLDSQTICAGELRFTVIHTPGHSPGGVCYYDKADSILFSGDTLFAGTIGRSDLGGGDYDKEIVSIMEKLMVLDADTELFPGHGCCSSIGYERTNNPFLEPFNEPEEIPAPDDGQ